MPDIIEAAKVELLKTDALSILETIERNAPGLLTMLGEIRDLTGGKFDFDFPLVTQVRYEGQSECCPGLLIHTNVPYWVDPMSQDKRLQVFVERDYPAAAIRECDRNVLFKNAFGESELPVSKIKSAIIERCMQAKLIAADKAAQLLGIVSSDAANTASSTTREAASTRPASFVPKGRIFAQVMRCKR